METLAAPSPYELILKAKAVAATAGYEIEPNADRRDPFRISAADGETLARKCAELLSDLGFSVFTPDFLWLTLAEFQAIMGLGKSALNNRLRRLRLSGRPIRQRTGDGSGRAYRVDANLILALKAAPDSSRSFRARLDRFEAALADREECRGEAAAKFTRRDRDRRNPRDAAA